MTKSHLIRDSAVMTSSTMPSEKYSCSGSPLMFWNGRTAIDGLSGRGREESATGATVDEVSPPIRYEKDAAIRPARRPVMRPVPVGPEPQTVPQLASDN